jgi:hypothetical protein
MQRKSGSPGQAGTVGRGVEAHRSIPAGYSLDREVFNATRDGGQKTALWSIRGWCPGPVVP